MNRRRFSFAVLCVLLAFLQHSSTESDESNRQRRRADPPWSRGQTDFNRNRGPPGLPPGFQSGLPPGQNQRYPPGWRKKGFPEDKETGGMIEVDDRKNQKVPNSPNEHTNIEERTGPTGPDYNTVCGNTNFHCGSGECVAGSARCNRVAECRDSSDEANCDSFSGKEEGTNGNGLCTLPAIPEGGKYEVAGCGPNCNLGPGDTAPERTVLNYTCDEDRLLVGGPIAVCVDGKWHRIAGCVKTCPPLTSTSLEISCSLHGEVVSCTGRIAPGTKASLACKRSYKLPVAGDPGYRELLCQDSGFWDKRLFRCLPECGTSLAHGETLIVRGFTAKLGVFPWHVGVYRLNEKEEYEQICGGSLISSNLVVSAAHCFYDEEYRRPESATQYAVAAGKRLRDWYSDETYAQKSQVEQIQVAKRYMGASGNFAQDIAILILAKPFEMTTIVRPVCLDWDNAYEREQLQLGKSGKAVGWGKTLEGRPSDTLQEINMPFVPYDRCLAAVPADFQGYITSDKFCAGRLNGSSLCDGDSGGGLCFEKDGTWYLRGVVSVSPVQGDSCDYNSYVGFTYVSQFRDWIRSIFVSH